MADISLDLVKSSSTYKDFLLVDGDLALTTDADPSGTNNVLQDILQRLSMFQGEWFMDNTAGVPYYQQILRKNPDQSKIDAIFINTICGTLGVQQLLSYAFVPNFAFRTLEVSFSCNTTSGFIDYTGTLSTGGIFG